MFSFSLIAHFLNTALSLLSMYTLSNITLSNASDVLSRQNKFMELPLHCAIAGGGSPVHIEFLFNNSPHFLSIARADGYLPIHVAASTPSPYASTVIQFLLTASTRTSKVIAATEKPRNEKTTEELVAEGEAGMTRMVKKHHIALATLTEAMTGGSEAITRKAHEVISRTCSIDVG